MDHYRRLISSNDSAGPRNRSAGLDELEKLAGLMPEQRKILRILFETVWPLNSPADFKPTSWEVGIPLYSEDPTVVSLATLLGYKRSRTDDYLKPLIRMGIVTSTRRGGKGGGFSICWSKVFEVCPANPPTPAPQPSDSNPPTLRSNVGGIGGLEGQKSEGCRRVDPDTEGPESEGWRDEIGGSEGYESEGCDTPDPVTHTIQQGCYYIANVIKVATKDAQEASTAAILQKLDLILEALNRLQPSANPPEVRMDEQPSNPPTTLQPSDPFKLNIEDSSLIKSIEIELKENPPTVQPSAEKSEGRTVAAAGQPAPVFDLGKVKYSGTGTPESWHPGRSLCRDDLANNAKLWQLWQHAVETFNWPNGLPGLRDFLALAEYTLNFPGDQGCGSFLRGVNARKCGPRRTTDKSANARADRRLDAMFPRGRESPVDQVLKSVADSLDFERTELFSMSIDQCRRLLTDLAKGRFMEAEKAGKDPRTVPWIYQDLVRALRARQRAEAPT